MRRAGEDEAEIVEVGTAVILLGVTIAGVGLFVCVFSWWESPDRAFLVPLVVMFLFGTLIAVIGYALRTRGRNLIYHRPFRVLLLSSGILLTVYSVYGNLGYLRYGIMLIVAWLILTVHYMQKGKSRPGKERGPGLAIETRL